MAKIITIGNFDGLHLGHQKLLSMLVEQAGMREQKSLVITYSNHPSEVLYNPRTPLLLCSTAEKVQLIKELGVDELDLLTFDKEFSSTSAESFLLDYLLPKHDPSMIIVGFDSHFGFQRQGNYEFLKQHGSRYGFDIQYVEPYLYQGTPVSSSLIRTKLRSGDVEFARQLLGRPFKLNGTVVRGKGLGRTLGFPTANLQLSDPRLLIPASGIYLTELEIGKRMCFGLTNIGTSPTVKHDGITEIETYIIDFADNVYDQQLSLRFLRRLRDEKVFPGLPDLIEAMKQDLKNALDIIGSLQ